MQNLWQFCLSFYQRPGVQDACLALQDEAGADVPLILALLWYEARGGQASWAEMKPLLQETRNWQQAEVLPLRNQRRSTLATVGRGQAYETAKAAELAAEKKQLAMIEAVLDEHIAENVFTTLSVSITGQVMLDYLSDIGADASQLVEGAQHLIKNVQKVG